MSDSVRDLAKVIHGLREDVNGLAGGPQLAYSSIEDGAVDEYDADGTLVSRIGTQFDGTHTTVSLAGPTPSTPVPATLESGPLSLTARWNGKFADDALSPMDLKQVEVWINTVNDYTTSRAVATIRGELGEQVTISPLTVEPHYVWLVARSESGKASDPSVVVSGTPDIAADLTEVEQALDTANQRLDTAETWIDDATTTLETTFPSRFQTIETDLSEIPNEISTAKQEAVTAAENYYDAQIVSVNSAITAAQTDATDALDAAQAAQATADGSIRTHYSITPPWPNGTVREDSDLGDLWYNSETDQAHRWNGTTWVIIQDSTIASALGKAEDAYELAGKKSTAYYQETPPVGVAGDIWYDTNDNNKPYFYTSGNVPEWIGNTANTGAYEITTSGWYGQRFTSIWSFTRAEMNVATYATSTSDIEIRLKNVDTGVVVSQKLINDVVDGSYVGLDFTTPVNGGTYDLEIREVAGTLAIWYSNADVNTDGFMVLDGEAISGGSYDAVYKVYPVQSPETWVPVRDGEIAEAELRAAEDALAKANQAKQDAIEAAALDATTKANEAQRLAEEAAALDATAKMETAEANAAIEAANIAQSKADAAEQDAIEQAELLVGEKGKVWIQNTAPVTGSEFDLWIDTSLNTEGLPKNQPNKWTGSTWEPVTDNVALSKASADAAALASAAQTAAEEAAALDATAKDEALEARAADEAARIAGVKASEALTDSKTYTDDVTQTALDNAETALTSANNKNAIFRDVTTPAGIGTKDGDIWFQFKDNTWTEVIGQWTWNGVSETWDKNTLSHETISSVDVGSLTVAGTATIDTGVIKKLFSEVVVAETITATEAFIGTNAIIEDTITASKIVASEELSAKVGEFITITADMIDANAITGTKISGGAIDGMLITGATFQTSGEGSGLKLSSEGFMSYDADGNITTSIPADGSAAFFTADVAAKSFTSLGQASFRGSGNEFAAGSVTTLAGGVSDPITPPSVDSTLDITQFPSADGHVRGITYVGGTWFRAVNRTGTSSGDRIEQLNSSGSVLNSFPVQLDPRFGLTQLSNGTIAVLGSAHGGASGDLLVQIYNTSTGQFLGEFIPARVGDPEVFDDQRTPAITSVGTNIHIAQTRLGTTSVWIYDGVISGYNGSIYPVNNTGPDTYSYNFDLGGFGYDSVGAIVFAEWDGNFTFPSGQNWSVPDNEGTRGFAFDGTNFYSYTNSHRLVKYSNNNLSSGQRYDAAYTWTDNTTGSETRVSPVTSFSYPGRARLKISTTEAPADASGIRYYLGIEGGALHLIGESAPNMPLILESMPANWQTAASPPTINSFPLSAAAVLASANAVFAVDGQGEGQWGQLQIDSTGTVQINSNPNEVLTFGANAGNRTVFRNPDTAEYTFSNISGGYSDIAFNEADVYGGRIQFMNPLETYDYVFIQSDSKIVFAKYNSTARQNIEAGSITTEPGQIYSGGVNLNLQGNSVSLNVGRDGTGPRITSDAINTRTYGSSANVVVTGFGTLGRSTSATKYKLAIDSLNVDEDALLSLKTKSWFDKTESEAVADYYTAEIKGEALEDEKGYPLYEAPSNLKRIPGMIAEEVEAAGLGDFVIYGEDGEIEGLMYDRLAVSLIPVVAKLRDRVTELENRLDNNER